MNLLTLAHEFDETDPEQIEVRISLAEKMKALLGDRAEDFDARYEAQGCIAATSILCQMRLAALPAGAALVALADAAHQVLCYARQGKTVDWIDILRRIQRDMLTGLVLVAQEPEPAMEPAPVLEGLPLDAGPVSAEPEVTRAARAPKTTPDAV